MKGKRNLCLLTMLFAMVMIFMLPSKAQAATVGDLLTSPEAGWQRYDDSDNNIIYYDNGNVTWGHFTGNPYQDACYKWTLSYVQSDTAAIGCGFKFKFYGTKFRIISIIHSNLYRNSANIQVKVDGEIIGHYSAYKDNSLANEQRLVYDKQGLARGMHDVDITVADNYGLTLDAIDIDDTGYLVPPAPTNVKTVSGDNKVTISWDPVKGATGYKIYRSTTPGNPNPTLVTTGSAITTTNFSDTGLENGTTYYYTISAIVNGIESPRSLPEAPGTPKAPSIITGDRAILVITFNNGKEKEYDLSADEIDNFTDWYDKRSDGSGKAYFALPKYGYVKPFNARKEFVKFDNIESFEIKDYNSK